MLPRALVLFPPPCPHWDYESHPDRHLIQPRIAQIIADLERARPSTYSVVQNTRPYHELIFKGLTVPNQPYLAGHYRGENFPCLAYRHVLIDGDAGMLPQFVDHVMTSLTKDMLDHVRWLDDLHKDPDAPPLVRVRQVVEFACEIFSGVLKVHPYANGNGHAVRLLVWAVLIRYGLRPKDWPVEPRPPDPPYTTLLREYRKGNREPLMLDMLSRVARGTPAPVPPLAAPAGDSL